MSKDMDLVRWLQAQDARDELAGIILALAAAGREIEQAILQATLEGSAGGAGTLNVQGEEQKQLDIITNDIALSHLHQLPQVGLSISEEIEQLIPNPNGAAKAPYAVCFDPLDGSSNIEVNASIGSIFSVLELDGAGAEASEAQVLASAGNQVAAGYVLYGPVTLLVLSAGGPVAIFALDTRSGAYVLLQDDVSIPQSASEYAINAAYARFWDEPVSTYVSQCNQGRDGPRKKSFNMRWSGAMVGDVHRLFVRGGVFLYPALNKAGSENGKLRFLYEANPMAMLIEKAGGRAVMGADRILSHEPESLHERVPVILGSSEEVGILTALYRQS